MRTNRNLVRYGAVSTRLICGLVVLVLMLLPIQASAAGPNKVLASGNRAFTLWGVFHHLPGHGGDESISLVYLGGQRVQNTGKSAFGASYQEGNTIGAVNLEGPLLGLIDAQNDLVLLILRTHGSYNGEDAQVTTGEFLNPDCTDCENVQWVCFPPGETGPFRVREGTDYCDAEGLGDKVIQRSHASIEREVTEEFSGNTVAGIRVSVHARLPSSGGGGRSGGPTARRRGRNRR